MIIPVHACASDLPRIIDASAATSAARMIVATALKEVGLVDHEAMADRGRRALPLLVQLHDVFRAALSFSQSSSRCTAASMLGYL